MLLCHGGPELDGHVRGRAERLAGMGYVAFALDDHAGGRWDLEANRARLVELTDQGDAFEDDMRTHGVPDRRVEVYAA